MDKDFRGENGGREREDIRKIAQIGCSAVSAMSGALEQYLKFDQADVMSMFKESGAKCGDSMSRDTRGSIASMQNNIFG